jgi:GT2 family glycosyltransferase
MADCAVDVVIPIFNAAKTVRSAVESIGNQTLTDIRIILVDDGSTDDTPRLLREMADADPRIDIVTQPNGGIVNALNAGLARCSAEFIARHDADDLAAPDRFAKQMAYLQSHPDCIAVSGAVRHIDAAGKFLGVVARLHSPDTADPRCVPAREPYLIHPFLMARHSALRAVGFYRHFLHAEDADLYWRLQELGRLHNMDDVLGDYRLHPESICSRSIVSCRILALSSQRAAISAMRRRNGRPDLTPVRKTEAGFAAAHSAEAILALDSEGLAPHEIDHLEIAMAAKMLEVTSYRPYELELSDCRFIHAAMRKHLRRLPAASRAGLVRSCSGTAARLLHRGLFEEAVALISPAQSPATIGRLALRVVTSPTMRGRLRRALGRDATVFPK